MSDDSIVDRFRAQLEGEAAAMYGYPDMTLCVASIAVSQKRIADSLELLARKHGAPTRESMRAESRGRLLSTALEFIEIGTPMALRDFNARYGALADGIRADLIEGDHIFEKNGFLYVGIAS